MAYILGEREFWGLPFKVSPAVLVPRPDSETVIEAALALLADRRPALADPWISAGLGLPAADAAARVSRPRAASGWKSQRRRSPLPRSNAVALKVDGAPAPAGRLARAGLARSVGGPFDLLVSNPPYVEAGAIAGLMPEVSRFEPKLALDGGPDGLAAYRAIAAEAPRLVAPGGRLLLEAGEGKPLKCIGFSNPQVLWPKTPGKTSAASTGWSH